MAVTKGPGPWGNWVYILHIFNLSLGEKLHHASSHVHFRLPQDNTTSKPSINQRTDSGLPQKSPCISPIPPPDSTATDAPKVQINGLRKEKHVVVNLPSVWSDISLSTISV